MLCTFALLAALAAPGPSDTIRAPRLNGMWQGRMVWLVQRSNCRPAVCESHSGQMRRYLVTRGRFDNGGELEPFMRPHEGGDYVFESESPHEDGYGGLVTQTVNDTIFVVDKDHLSVLCEVGLHWAQFGEECVCRYTCPMTRTASPKQAAEVYARDP